MKKFLHWLFGHKWLYGDWKGIQGQPTKRACKKCGKIEVYGGPMGYETYIDWYKKASWKTEEQWAEIAARASREREEYAKLIS